MTDEVQLRDSSAEAYQLQQLKVFEFKERCPIETMFTAEHAKGGIEFDPAVWKPMELQQFLIHAIKSHAAQSSQYPVCFSLYSINQTVQKSRSGTAWQYAIAEKSSLNNS